MSSSSSQNKKIILKSSDGESFEIDEVMAVQSHTIKHMINDDCVNELIHLPNVNSNILSKVIEYCKKHVKSKDVDRNTANTDGINAFDAKFIKTDQNTLFELILAAYYLNIKTILDLCCQTVADMIKDKTPEEIRKKINIVNDFTPEEDAVIRQENQWALNSFGF